MIELRSHNHLDMTGEDTMARGDTQQTYFQITNSVPEQAWYWGAIASILASAGLKLAGQNNWSIFVGQWPPTFLLFGLYHRMLRPGK